ncbi:hypothetical protein CSAL01_13567 [Colletotrichum salicis]|uniref:Cytochrome P450 n=1 Tax=Colletotrichum salicis TaxID=1209931 RepID=A0A135V983_9PEZI|nr:hypothetical protein CSAL01_13567 [Colletotrichum salicis]
MVSAGVPTQTALSEAKENLGPGTDTTSESLVHILYALSWNPTYQEKLYQDLASRSFPTDLNTLENIPRLKACVKEGIRWAGASVVMLPRVVPKGGVELCGKFVPEGSLTSELGFSYLELYMSVAKMVANFELTPADGHPRSAQVTGLTNADWQPVPLPKRKEWVSAVVTEPLLIKTMRRRRV